MEKEQNFSFPCFFLSLPKKKLFFFSPLSLLSLLFWSILKEKEKKKKKPIQPDKVSGLTHSFMLARMF